MSSRVQPVGIPKQGPQPHKSVMSSSSGSVFSDTLQEITNTKLDELSKRRAAFEHAKAAAISSLDEQQQASGGYIQRLQDFANGVKKAFGVRVAPAGTVLPTGPKTTGLEFELRNLDRFLAQARHDPSVSARMLSRWEENLLRHLEVETLRYAYASLYGQLVTEWLSASGSGNEKTPGSTEDVEMSEVFESVDSAKKLASRMEWEKNVFEPAHIDVGRLNNYLLGLFGLSGGKAKEKKAVSKALTVLRDAITTFETGMAAAVFGTTSLDWVINSLLASDRLSDEKREVLLDFKKNPIILAEIADVLNMRLAALDSWSWGAGGVPVEQRRKVSGTYDIHMHEDLLQAMFLQYIGVRWSVFLKEAFHRFRKADDDAWLSNHADIPLIDRKRLGYYLGPIDRKPSLQAARKREYRRNYFVTQLLDSETQHPEADDGEEEADYQQAAPKPTSGKAPRITLAREAARKSAPSSKVAVKRHRRTQEGRDREAKETDEEEEEDEQDEDDEEDEDSDHYRPKKQMLRKQRLLHLLSTEIAINTQLRGEITAFHSVFESWDQLLPHQTVRTVLAFFGVSEVWLDFFTRFLEAPLRFLGDDDDDEYAAAEPRIRRRGTPAAHVISDVFAEVVLFCLDFAVNQTTSGDFLWRVRDDFWFWTPDHQTCVKAWAAVTRFAEVTGTTLSAGKTGTVRIFGKGARSGETKIDARLPRGQIRWGFLYLSPETGRFVIDQDMVDVHIAELQKQLQDKRKSVFAFIQAWNTYVATFFTSNFGQPGNCFGRDHVDEVLRTHERIQRQIFAALLPQQSGGSGGPWSSSSSSSPDRPASIVDFLKAAIRERFGVTDIPDGYFFFPVGLGGLGLVSPFVSLLQRRDAMLQSPDTLFVEMHESEQAAYERAKAAFDSGAVKASRFSLDDPDWEPADPADRETFMSFEEFVRWRDEYDFSRPAQVHQVFFRLMRQPSERSPDQDPAIISAMSRLSSLPHTAKDIQAQWIWMDPYWRWVAIMYGPEILDRFGGLNIVDPGLLPMGMVTLFRNKRVKWQG